VVVATRVDEFEFARLVEAPLGVAAGEEKTLNLIGRVQRVFFLGIELVAVGFEYAAQIAGIGRPVLIDDGAEDQHLSVAKHIGGHPEKRAPVDAEAKIAFPSAR